MIVDKEEYPVLAGVELPGNVQRAAETTSGGYVAIARPDGVVLVVEEGIRVQIFIAKVRIYIAVELFGAGFGGQIDVPTGAATVFGLVVRGLDVYLG